MSDAPRIRMNTDRNTPSMAGAMKNVRPHSAPTMPENSIQPHIDTPMLRTLNAPTTSNTPNTMKNAPMNHASAPADTSGFTKNRMPSTMSSAP